MESLEASTKLSSMDWKFTPMASLRLGLHSKVTTVSCLSKECTKGEYMCRAHAVHYFYTAFLGTSSAFHTPKTAPTQRKPWW